MARINPSQVQHIKSMQPDFEFQLRKIQPSLGAASADELFSTGDADNASSSDETMSVTAAVGTALANSGSNTPNHVSMYTTDNAAVSRDMHSKTHTEALALEPLKPINIPDQNRFISNEDRLLLTRVKWVLKRLIDVEPVKEPVKADEATLGANDDADPDEENDDILEEGDEEGEDGADGKLLLVALIRSHMTVLVWYTFFVNITIMLWTQIPVFLRPEKTPLKLWWRNCWEMPRMARKPFSCLIFCHS